MKKYIIKYKTNLIQFSNYFLIGGIATVIDFILLYFFKESFNLPLLTANSLSFCVALFFNFTCQKYVTFKTKGNSLSQFFTFTLIASFGLLINSAILYFLVEFLGFWYLSAKVFATSFSFIWNFLANKSITFKK